MRGESCFFRRRVRVEQWREWSELTEALATSVDSSLRSVDLSECNQLGVHLSECNQLGVHLSECNQLSVQRVEWRGGGKNHINSQY